MMDINRVEIRRDVIQRFRMRMFKLTTLVIHVIVWCWTALYGMSVNPGWVTAIPVMLLWIAIIFLHGIWAADFLKSPWTSWVEHATAAEIAQERKRRSLIHQNEDITLEKQNRTMRLSDDGELVEVEPEQSLTTKLWNQ
jgi:hypothetical protein